MSVGGLMLLALLGALVLLWIGLPLRRTTTLAQPNNPSELRRERLEVYYSRVLRNLHDLDEDYATGKLDADDYQREREGWVSRGAAALQALDELAVAPDAAQADTAVIDADIEAEIEAAVTAYRAGTPASSHMQQVNDN
ncbi:MAG: hypothetical protein H7Y11_05875 [Armatimonadetes bacterium]|nr:hypothetical protein [Anaerolineae bacterium]